MSDIKAELYTRCADYIKMRMEAAEQGIKEAQQASTEDTKSSAGDKYETGRAMMQQETDRNMQQLSEANKLRVALNSIGTGTHTTVAEAGSVVYTNNGNFYLAISAGSLLVHGVIYFAVSPASPIGLKLKGQKKGGEFTLNGKTYKIERII